MRRTLALLIGLALAFGIGEALVRWAGLSQPGSPFQIFRRSAYVDYDPLLGHAPRGPGTYYMSGWRVTITAAGLRANGRAAPDGTPWLAVGDSFTFGDQVSDAETWPA